MSLSSERLRGNAALSGALSSIAAAVVSVILHAIWFALHVLFDTVVETRVLGLTFDIAVLSSANWAATARVRTNAAMRDSIDLVSFDRARTGTESINQPRNNISAGPVEAAPQ